MNSVESRRKARVQNVGNATDGAVAPLARVTFADTNAKLNAYLASKGEPYRGWRSRQRKPQV